MELLEWIRRNALAMTTLAAGVLIGLILRLPVFPYALPEATANVLGAAFGAIFAVWGAAWLADRKERSSHLLAVRAIEATIAPLFSRAASVEDGLEEVIALHRAGSDREARISAVKEVLAIAQQVPLLATEIHARIEFMEPLFLQLGGPGVIAHGTLIHTGPALKSAVEKLVWAAFYEDVSEVEKALAQLRADNDEVIGQAERAVRLANAFAKGQLGRADDISKVE